AQATPGVVTPPAPQTPVPAIPVGQNTSHNWSGYAATSGTYTGVTGTWTVPAPGINSAPGVGATWVGIGGVSSHDLIPAGTQDVAAPAMVRASASRAPPRRLQVQRQAVWANVQDDRRQDTTINEPATVLTRSQAVTSLEAG